MFLFLHALFTGFMASIIEQKWGFGWALTFFCLMGIHAMYLIFSRRKA